MVFIVLAVSTQVCGTCSIGSNPIKYPNFLLKQKIECRILADNCILAKRPASGWGGIR